MNSSLWQTSLLTIRQNFATPCQHGGPLGVLLVDLDLSEDQPRFDPPSTPDGPLEHLKELCPHSQLVRRGVSRLHCLDARWHPRDPGSPFRWPRGRRLQRMIAYFGDKCDYERYELPARVAASVVSTTPALRNYFSAETLELDIADSWWTYAVFDLAWRDVPGSGLHSPRTAWNGKTTCPLSDALSGLNSRWMVSAETGRVKRSFAEIQDLASASIHAIDLLVDTPLPSADVVGSCEADGGAGSTPGQAAKKRTSRKAGPNKTAKRAAKRKQEKDDKRLWEAWANGSGHYRTIAELAKEKGISKLDARHALDRHRKRLERAGKWPPDKLTR